MAFVNSFSHPGIVAGIAALFVALGVPLGYIIYQIYFALKWTFIKEETILASVEGIEELQQLTRGKKRLELWNVIESYNDYLMTVKSYEKRLSYEDLVRRYERFNDRTSRIHGLGSSILSMIMGGISFFVVGFITRNSYIEFLDSLNNSSFWIVMFAFSISLLAIIYNYNTQNKHSFVQLNKLMVDVTESDDKGEERPILKREE